MRQLSDAYGDLVNNMCPNDAIQPPKPTEAQEKAYILRLTQLRCEALQLGIVLRGRSLLALMAITAYILEFIRFTFFQDRGDVGLLANDAPYYWSRIQGAYLWLALMVGSICAPVGSICAQRAILSGTGTAIEVVRLSSITRLQT